MIRAPRLQSFVLVALLAVALISSGCGLFKKCGGCPSFSQTKKQARTEAVAAIPTDRSHN